MQPGRQPVFTNDRVNHGPEILERRIQLNMMRRRDDVKWPRAAGPFLAAVKLEGRLLVVLYQAAKGCVCC